jgi:hypothetical protein
MLGQFGLLWCEPLEPFEGAVVDGLDGVVVGVL